MTACRIRESSRCLATPSDPGLKPEVHAGFEVHELPVTQGVLEVVLAAAERAEAHRVRTIELVIGDLSSIVDDSVQFYFDILSKGTIAEGAELRFRRESAEMTCLDCGSTVTVSAPLSPWCEKCGSGNVRLTGGRAFRVESIEVDDEDSGSQGDP